MSLAHLHLILNHSPIFAAIFGFIILIYGRWRNSREIMAVALGMFVMAALLTIPTYFTGDYAASEIRDLPTFSKAAVEEHEDAALWAFIAVGALGLMAAFGLTFALRDRKPPKWLPIIATITAILTIIIFIRTAQLGGLISHPELRSGFVAPPFQDDD